MNVSHLCRMVGAPVLALAALADAAAQGGPRTPDQIGKDHNALQQDAEAQEARRRAEQQRAQQQADEQWNTSGGQRQPAAAPDRGRAEAVRRSWQQRPPLAPAKNPLLGRWESLGVGQGQGVAAGMPAEMAAFANAMLGGITADICDSMLGRGTIEFRPGGLVAIGRDGRERPLYRAEYRGGGSRVVVLPQAGADFSHMIVDFEGPDRASVAAIGCALARAPGGGTAAAAMPTANTRQSPPAGTQAAVPAARFGGTWNTLWGHGSQAVLELTQTGTDVTGAYAGSSRGKVTGRIAGQVLTGHWTGTEAVEAHGGFVLTVSADGKSFTGTWGTGSSRDNGGSWVGSRR